MNKRGFTLIELLGVIVLIAIISLLAFPSILNHIKKAQDTIDKTTKNLVINAAKNYVNDNLYFFPKVEDNVFCVTLTELLSNKYLDKAIIDENELLKDKIIKIKYTTKYKYSIVNSCNGINIEIPDEEIIHPYYDSIFDFDESTNTIKGFKEGVDISLYTNLVIPSEINGVAVTTIGESAFSDKGLVSVTIPCTVTVISRFAFSNNPELTTINLGEGIQEIRAYAFRNHGASELIIPASLTILDQYAFDITNEYASLIGNLKKVTIKEDSTKKWVWVGYNVFEKHSPEITVYVDLSNEEGNKTINWNHVINDNSSEDAALYCNDKSITTLLDGMIICKYE